MHEFSLQKNFKNLQKKLLLIEVQLTLINFVGSRRIQSMIFRAQNQSFTAVCPAKKTLRRRNYQIARASIYIDHDILKIC